MKPEAKNVTHFDILDRKVRRECQLAKAGLQSENRARLLLQLVDALFVDHFEWPQEQWAPNTEEDLRPRFNSGGIPDRFRVFVDLTVGGVSFKVNFSMKDSGEDPEIFFGSQHLVFVNGSKPETIAAFCKEAAVLVEKEAMKVHFSPTHPHP